MSCPHIGRLIVQWVLFLCSGNHYRSRFAEEYFNYIARSLRLPWRADSRGLASDIAGLGNAGPISRNAVRELDRLGMAANKGKRMPAPATADDLHEFDMLIAMYEHEHRPMIESRFATVASAVTYWQVPDIDEMEAPEALAIARQHIDQLIESLQKSSGP